MKQQLFKTTILLLLAIGSLATLHAQQTPDALKAALETKHFIFTAQTVMPTSSAMRQIGGDRYEVRISGDSLRSDLPYFGRAYSAPMNGEGGIKFTSTKYDYSLKERKRGGWEVLIRPKDGADLRQFLFTVSGNGSASLQALSNNRQPISFNGTVAALQ